MTCTVEGCEKPVEKCGLCAGHRKQRQRHQALKPLRDYAMGAEERLSKAAIRYADAESDKEFDRARKLLSKYSQGRAGRQQVATAVRVAVETVLERLGVVRLPRQGDIGDKAKLSPAPVTLSPGDDEKAGGHT